MILVKVKDMKDIWLVRYQTTQTIIFGLEDFLNQLNFLDDEEYLEQFDFGSDFVSGNIWFQNQSKRLVGTVYVHTRTPEEELKRKEEFRVNFGLSLDI